jgi:hypothetical protein
LVLAIPSLETCFTTKSWLIKPSKKQLLVFKNLQAKFLQIHGRAIPLNVILGLKNRGCGLMTKDIHGVTKITFHSVTFRYKIT